MNISFDKFNILDARKLSTYVQKSSVDVIITSPPYWDLKDYGSTKQIGFGQNKLEYLDDIERLLKDCFNILKPTGSMWLIADNYRKNGSVHLLPWEIGARALKVGWSIRDMIIWDKQYNVPWHQKGQLRNTSEFILLMTKTDNYKYYVDRIKELDEISKWWVDFPERFNPKGKTPTNIWSFPIRRRGTWPTPAKVDHFCSLPTGLIGRIIELTTNPGDLVMDPFAGSGVVLAQAKSMGRHFLGCDVNPEYKKMFPATIKEVEKEWEQVIARRKKQSIAKIDFEKTIMELRVLKYSRQIAKAFADMLVFDSRNTTGVLALLCLAKLPKNFDRNKYIDVDLIFIVKSKSGFKKALTNTQLRSNKVPLSHFGINSTITTMFQNDVLKSRKVTANSRFYAYPTSHVRKFVSVKVIKEWLKDDTLKDLFIDPKNIPILSNLGVDVDWVLD